MVSYKLFKEKQGTLFYSYYLLTFFFSVSVFAIIRNESFFVPQLRQIYNWYVLFIFVFLFTQFFRNIFVTFVILLLNIIFSIYITFYVFLILDIDLNIFSKFCVLPYLFVAFAAMYDFRQKIKQCKDPHYVNQFQQIEKRLIWGVGMISGLIIIFIIGNIAYSVLFVPNVNEVQYTTGTLERDDYKHRDEYKYIVNGQEHYVRAKTGIGYQSDTANIAYSIENPWFAVVQNDLNAFIRFDLTAPANALMGIQFISFIYFMSNRKKIVIIEKEEQLI